MTSGEFTEKFLPMGERLYRLAFSLLEDTFDAEDAVQDLFVKLWNSRDILDSVRSPEAYCLTMMRNLCLDRIRTRKRSTGLQENTESESGPPDRHIDDRERLKATAKAIEGLSPSQRTILKMKVLEDLSYDEISERTGMSKLTLRVLLSQARKKIRKTI